jgi:regulatory protein
VSAERGLELAYRYLSRRERTVAETREHLASSDLDGATADQVITMLAGQGYLDDRRFARLFVQDKRELEQWGDERIRRGLESRGVDRDLAEEAIVENGGYLRELERAVALLRRRVPHPEPDRRGRERILGLLLRRGYDYELADAALREHLSG